MSIGHSRTILTKEKPRGWRGPSGYCGPSCDAPNILAETLDNMGDELTTEVLKVLSLLRALQPVSDKNHY